MRRQWISEQEPRWRRLEALLAASTHADATSLRETTTLYREVVNDLSRAQSQPELQHLEPYLSALAQRGHNRLYEHPAATWQDIVRFFTHGFPQCFRRNFRFILLAFGTFMLGTVLAMLTLRLDPQTDSYFLPPSVIADLKQGVLWMDHTVAHPAESSFLMTNNIRVAINAYATGVLFGVGTLAILFHNGMFAFGGPLGLSMRYGLGGKLLNFILPHGVIELSTIFIAGGAGMMIGFALLFPGERARWDAVRHKGQESLVLIMGCIPLLVIAGLIEGMISLNQAVGTPLRMGVAAMSAVFLGLYLGFSGRPKPPEAPNSPWSLEEPGSAV